MSMTDFHFNKHKEDLKVMIARIEAESDRIQSAGDSLRNQIIKLRKLQAQLLELEALEAEKFLTE